MKYYAAKNTMNFANTWEVLVFDSKKSRDEYVNKWDGHYGYNVWDVRAIKKSEVTQYASNYSMTRNEYNTPKPFSGQFWGISDWDEDMSIGLLGHVEVCDPHDKAERLF